jgi:hypothetical protein
MGSVEEKSLWSDDEIDSNGDDRYMLAINDDGGYE